MNTTRRPIRPRSLLGFVLWALAAAPSSAFPQNNAAASSPYAFNTAGLPEGTTREQMWWAPKEDDWKKPCLVTFQRTWEDAVAVAQETQRAILVCVNMDGEIASEHYAGIRYRTPETAALYEPYVCVMASVYRHTPRDFDEEGRRILCPRFGSVTCGEHIAIEPVLYEKFFDGQRIAPRHIMVELDGKEVYDVFYAWDTDSVFAAIKNGIANRTVTPTPVVRGDRPIFERVASRDIADRVAVEAAYRDGDAETKKKLLEAALANVDKEPVDLLRLAVKGFDVELAAVARKALAGTTSEGALDLIAEALKLPVETAEREALIAALARIGETSPRARSMATTHRGLSGRSTTVNADAFVKAYEAGAGASYSPAPAAAAVAAKIEKQDEALSSGDANARVELAEALLARAVERLGYLAPTGAADDSALPKVDEKEARLLLLDANRIALEAEKLGATGWRVNAAISVSAYYLGQDELAHARAEASVKGMPPDAPGWNAMVVLALFAEARWNAIRQAVLDKKPWPKEWFTDVNDAYTVLARHPNGSDSQAAMHYDIVKWLGAAGQAARVLDQALARFPDSWELHQRFRDRILEEKGVDGLEPAYESRLSAAAAAPQLEWYAGYASLVTAEFRRREGSPDEAVSAYDRCLAHFDKSARLDPEIRDTADHYAALALAGRARIALEREDYGRAVADLVASLERKPDAAGTLDGLNLSPSDTSRTLKARLGEKGLTELLAKLEAALAKIDPELLQLPAYERPPAPPAPAEGGERRRGR